MPEIAQKSTISKGTYHLFIGNLVSTVALAFVAIIVGRLLGPDRYGLYTIALIIPAYAYLLLRWGVSSTVTRYGAKFLSEGDERKAVSFGYTISTLHLAMSLLAVGLLIPFSNIIATNLLNRPELATGIIIPVALLSVVGQVLFYNGSAALVGLHEFGKSAVLQTINAFGKLAVSVFLVILGYSTLGAVLGYTLGFIIAGVISLVVLVLMNKSLIPKNIKEDVGITMKYAPPIYLSVLLINIISPFQNTILAYTVSNTEIGWYSAALNIATLTTLFTYPVSTALLPLFSKTMHGGTRQLAGTYKLSVKYSALFVTPVAMLVMALSTPLASAIYGHSYQFAGNYLIVIAVGGLLVGLGGISWSSFLYGVGKTRTALVTTGVGSAVSIVTSIVLIFYVGVYGAIIGTILGNAVSLILGSRFISNILETKLQTWIVWRIYLSSALSAVLIYPISLFSLNPFLVVIIGGVLFIIVLIPVMAWTKALTRNDMSALHDQFKDVKMMNYLLHLIGRYHGLFERKKIGASV